jgi:hypothetical protein
MRRFPPAAVVVVLALAAAPALAAEESLARSELALAEGLFAWHEGRLSAAVNHFSQAVELNPRDGTAQAWLDAARRKLAGETAAEPEPPELAKPLDDRGLWEGSVGAGLTFDTNPNLFSDELSLPPPGDTASEPIRGEESDAAMRLAAGLGLYPFHARSAPNLGITFQARRSFQGDFDFLDLTEARSAVQLAWGSDPLGFVEGPIGSARVPFGTSRFAGLLQVGASLYQLDDARYLSTVDGAASLTWRQTGSTATRLDLAFADRDFADRGIEEQKSGEDLALQVSQAFYLGRGDRFVRVGVRALQRAAGRAFDASALEVDAEAALPVALRWEVRLRGAWREDDFDHPESNLFAPASGVVRDDETLRATATVLFRPAPRLRWLARATWVDRASTVDLGENLPDLDYRRFLLTAGIHWQL